MKNLHMLERIPVKLQIFESNSQRKIETIQRAFGWNESL